MLGTILVVTSRLDARQADRPVEEQEKVEAYLENLGLTDLRILFLEQQVAEHPDDRGSAAAKTLADLYASQLLSITDPETVADLNRRIDGLLKSHPSARTTALEIMRLQGDYNRAEGLIVKWINDPADSASRDASKAIFDRITPEYGRLQSALLNELNLQRDVIDSLPDGPVKSRKEQAVDRLEEVAGRALYSDAWSNFYLGLLSPPEQGKPRFQHAQEGFRKLLGVEKADQARAEMLATPGMARAALGAALSARAARDETTGQTWFQLLADPATSADVRDMVDFWQAWSLLQSGQTSKINELVERLGTSIGATNSNGQEALCALLVRVGFDLGDRKADPALTNLGMQGLRGLVRMKKYDRVRLLASRYGITAAGQDDLVTRWLAAENLFDAARKSRSKGDSQAAAKGFESALNATDVRRSPELAAHCRYLLGWSLYQSDEFARAADEFARAAIELRVQKSDEAPDAAWMNAVALQRAASADPSRSATAIEAFQAFARDFPGHPNARNVELEVLKLQGGAITVDAVESHKPTDANYPALCLAAIRHHQQQWRTQRAAGQDGTVEASRLERAIALYRKSPEASKTPSRSLEALLAEVDLALLADPPNAAQARERLASAESLVGSIPEADRAVIAYHQARLQLAQTTGDTAEARAQAVWLSQHQTGSNAEQAALIVLAKMADTALSQTDPDRRPARLLEAHNAYQRLSDALGHSADVLKSNRNALIAASRLASYAFELGRFEEAAERYDAILKAYPRDANYLRRAGLAHVQAGHFDRALDCWQVLVNGLPSGSDSWFEAKYQQMETLARLDRAQAAQAFRQFRILHPDLGPSRLRPLFQTLEEDLAR